ncbi:MAG: mechanosensitive ion channel [Longimicrobiales bacterium]|nr:mechanosensitive ion channel [Longimicrobiales bacterium]
MNLNDVGGALSQWLGFQLFEVGGTAVTGASIVTFVIIVLFALWASRVAQRIVTGLMSRGGVTSTGTLATTRRLVHYAVLLVGLAVAMQTIGISLATVFAAGAVAAVAIGFALQNILQNFVSGIILLTERSIRETDILEVEGMTVRIVRMGARATVARTREEEELIIPNSILVQSTVKNLTLSDPEFRVRCRVGVSYDSDMARVEEVLYAAGQRAEGRTESRDPVVQLLDFGDSSVLWEVSIWATDPWAAPTLRSDVHRGVWWALKDAGITIAYPQLQLHFDAARLKGLQA